MQKTRRGVRNFIGGEWVDGDGRETEPIYDPATGEVVAETPLSTKEDVDRAVKAAPLGTGVRPRRQDARGGGRVK